MSASALPPPSTACTPSLATSRRYAGQRVPARARACIATRARMCDRVAQARGTDAPRVQVGPPTGIETLEADTFRLECYQTPTGIKFLMLAEPKATALDTILKQVYSL